MRLCAVTFLMTLAGLGAGVAQASAAQIQVNRSCYADPDDRADTVALTGSGFEPNAAYQVTLDGQPLTGGTGKTDAAGNLSGKFVAPGVGTVSRIAQQHTFRLGVQQGANAPVTTFTVSKLFASFKPQSGDPSTLKVRFSLYGFRLQGASKPAVYVHYVGPSGRVARSVRLGTAGQACGFLRTPQRRLFGFSANPGKWHLQFDTRKTYKRGTSKSTFLYFTLPVDVS